MTSWGRPEENLQENVEALGAIEIGGMFIPFQAFLHEPQQVIRVKIREPEEHVGLVQTQEEGNSTSAGM